MYVQDFCLGKIKCFDGVEPRITGEIGEKPKDENQMIHRVEKEPLDSLHGNDHGGLIYGIVDFAFSFKELDFEVDCLSTT